MAKKRIDTEGNIWRRRVMAAIGAWLKQTNKPSNARIIISIACRAARVEDFNKISKTKLRSIYSEFVDRQKTNKSVTELEAKICNSKKTTKPVMKLTQGGKNNVQRESSGKLKNPAKCIDINSCKSTAEHGKKSE